MKIQCRYFAAKKDYDIAMEKLQRKKDCMELTALQEAVHTSSTNLMLSRCEEIEVALREYNMEASADERWTLGLDMFGYRTHYIVEEDGNVLVRISGSQENLPLFEQLAVIRELQLYKEWVPFCDKSEKLHEVARTDVIAYMNIWSPFGE